MGTWGRPPTCECGDCTKCRRRVRERERYRAMTPEQRRARRAGRDKERIKREDRARHRARKSDPDYKRRRTALNTVNNAIRAGRLERGPCEREGDDCYGVVQAHHDDYDRPLDVRWLCVGHHALEHSLHVAPTHNVS